MKRRDAEYWQRLRTDRRSGTAVLFTAVAPVVTAVATTMASVPGTQWEARTSPIYWIVLMPVAWWVSSLAAYEPWAVRIWKPSLIILCAIHGICLAIAISGNQDVMLTACSFVLTIACAAAGMVALRGSMVAREGPAR